MEPMIDYVQENREFLENKHFLTFDMSDTDEVQMAKYGLSIRETIFIAWTRHIFHDVVMVNKSKLIGIGGTHRAGKSEWACTMGFIWDSTFFPRIKERVVHTTDAFLQEVGWVKDNNVHGAVFVIDEGGVVAPSDSFYEKWYKELNQALQVMGYLNPIIIFCAVIRDNIGSKFRKLYNIQCKAKRYNNDFARIKIFDLNYDDLRGKTIPKRPIVRIFGQKYVMNAVKFGKPPHFISEAYKHLSIPKKDKLLDKIIKSSSDGEKAGPEKTHREKERDRQKQYVEEKLYDVVAKFQQYGAKRSRPGNISLDVIKIQSDLNISKTTAEMLKRKAEDFLNQPDKPIKKS